MKHNAIIFDMDGLLLDTEIIAFNTWTVIPFYFTFCEKIKN